jgi:glycyl-tRNA synthetase
MFLLLMCSAYKEEEVGEGDRKETRVVLALPPQLAPVKVAIFPLTKKDGLPEKAREIMDVLKLSFRCHYEEKDAIGKRYRRHDAIGTPFCITVDHESLENNTVTLRYRDSMLQERVAIADLEKIIGEQTSLRSIFAR